MRVYWDKLPVSAVATASVKVEVGRVETILDRLLSPPPPTIPLLFVYGISSGLLWPTFDFYK